MSGLPCGRLGMLPRFACDDKAASYFNINPQFGELEITEPFDSAFEVRGVHGNDQNWRTSKIIIEGNSNGGVCLLPADTRIMIHCLNWPVTIHWDTVLRKQISTCHKNVILTPSSLTFLLQHWFESDIYYCMMRTDSLRKDFIYEQEPVYQGWLLQHSFEVQGQGLTEINGLYYTGFSCPLLLHPSQRLHTNACTLFRKGILQSCGRR